MYTIKKDTLKHITRNGYMQKKKPNIIHVRRQQIQLWTKKLFIQTAYNINVNIKKRICFANITTSFKTLKTVETILKCFWDVIVAKLSCKTVFSGFWSWTLTRYWKPPVCVYPAAVHKLSISRSFSFFNANLW